MMLPKVTVASCTFKGGYHLITEVYAAVVAWLDANRYESAGPVFNIYHVSPHETQSPDESVTEVCYPVKKRWQIRRGSHGCPHPHSGGWGRFCISKS